MYQQNRHPKLLRSRKFLIANPCRCHGHGHRSVLGRPCQRTVFTGICRIAVHKKTVPKIFDSQSMPPPWAWSSVGFGPILQPIDFYRNQRNRHQKNRFRQLLIANPCCCHGHGYRSGLGRARQRRVFIRIRRIGIQKKSVPKIFDNQSMPPPWAWSSLGLGPILEAISF